MAEYITDDIFGVAVRMMEEIQVDEEEQAKKYILSLAERIARLRKKYDLEKESINSNSQSGSSVSFVLSDDSAREVEPDCIYISSFLEIDHAGVVYSVPKLSKTNATEQWKAVLSHHSNRLQSMISNFAKCSYYTDELNTIIERMNQWNTINMPNIKSKRTLELSQRTMRRRIQFQS